MRDDKERNLLAVMIFSTFLIYIKALHLSYIKMERQSLALCSGMIYGGLLSKSTYVELYSFARYMKFSLKKN